MLVIEEYDKLDCAMRGFFRQLLENGRIANVTLNRCGGGMACCEGLGCFYALHVVYPQILLCWVELWAHFGRKPGLLTAISHMRHLVKLIVVRAGR